MPAYVISDAALAEAPTLYSDEAAAALFADPAFPDYLRRSVATWCGETDDGPMMTANLRDARHFITSLMMIHLHTTPGGLTLTRLMEALRLAGMAPARAAPALAVTLVLGLIERAPSGDDNRVRAYRPTGRMAAAMIERFRRTLAAAAPLDPGVARALDRYDDPDFALSLIGQVAEIGLAVNGANAVADDSLSAISTRSSGMMVLGRLLALADREGAAFPPVGPVAFSGAAIARGCGISRTQVRRILRAGAEAGHFVLVDEGLIELTPRLAEHVAYLCLVEFLACRWAAARMTAEASVRISA